MDERSQDDPDMKLKLEEGSLPCESSCVHSNWVSSNNKMKEGRNEIDLVFQRNDTTHHQLVDSMVEVTSSYSQAHGGSSNHCENEFIFPKEVYVFGTIEDHQENDMKHAKGDNEVYDHPWLFGPEWMYSQLVHVIKETCGVAMLLELLQVGILLRDQNQLWRKGSYFSQSVSGFT